MLYRCLKVIATGQWVNVLFTDAGDAFSVPELSHRTAIAAALGLSPDSLETVEAARDPRSGVLLEMPVAPLPPPTRREELLSKGRSNWTPGERDELLELVSEDSRKN